MSRPGSAGSSGSSSTRRVDVLAVGDADAIEALAAWLQQGPPAARVDGVVREPAAVEAVAGFEVA